MVETRNAIKGLDTGQLSELNRLEVSQNQGTKLEMLKSVKNQQNNANFNGATNAEDNVTVFNINDSQSRLQEVNEEMTRSVQFHEEVIMKDRMNQESQKQTGKKGLSIEIEMAPDSDDQACAVEIATAAEQLITRWKEKKVIDGVYGINGQVMKTKFDKIQKWAIQPKIVRKSKHVAVELIIDVKSSESAFKLFQHEKEYCQHNKIRVGARNTKLEYTKRVGFLTGPCLKIASPKKYIDDLNKYCGIEDGMIDVKKKFTYAKGSRSRVLVVLVIESKAKEINELLCMIKSPRFKYVSYQKSTTDEKLRAMYHNDKHNETAKYEILENTRLDDEVIDEKTDEKILLEELMLTSKKGGEYLFLAAEQGDGRHQNDVIVIVNPKIQHQAKRWLVENFMNLDFVVERQRSTTVDPSQFRVDNTYTNSLQEFLNPKINEKEIAKSKYGRKLKTYAEATKDEDKGSNENTNSKTNANSNKKKENTQKQTNQNQEIKQTMELFQKQINNLTDLIVFMIREIVTDEKSKSEMEAKLQSINQNATDKEKVEEEKIEESEKTQNQAQRKHRQRNEKRSETAENDKKKMKTANHKTIESDDSGDVNKVIWYNSFKKHQKEGETTNKNE